MPKKHSEIEVLKKKLESFLSEMNHYNFGEEINEIPGALTLEVTNKTKQEVYELCFNIQEELVLDITRIIVEQKSDHLSESNPQIKIHSRRDSLVDDVAQARFLFNAINQAVYASRFENLETLLRRGAKPTAHYEHMIVVYNKAVNSNTQAHYEFVEFRRDGTEYRTPWTYTLSLLTRATNEEREQVIEVIKLLFDSNDNYLTPLNTAEKNRLDKILAEKQMSPGNSKKALKDRADAHTSPMLYLQHIRRSIPEELYDEVSRILLGHKHANRHTR